MYKIMTGTPERNRQLGGPRRRLHRKIILKRIVKTGYDGVEWINISQYMAHWKVFANTAKNFRFP